MSDNDPQNLTRTAVAIPFPSPFRPPKRSGSFDNKTSARQAHEAAANRAKARAKRRKSVQNILTDFPAVMAHAFDDFRPASIAVWRSDIEEACDEQFVLAEEFLARFRKVTSFAHVSSYSLKTLCEDYHRSLGRNDVYISNGVLIVAAVSLRYRGKCISGTPNAIFNLSRRDLKLISRWVAEHHAVACAANLRERSK